MAVFVVVWLVIVAVISCVKMMMAAESAVRYGLGAWIVFGYFGFFAASVTAAVFASIVIHGG